MAVVMMKRGDEKDDVGRKRFGCWGRLTLKCNQKKTCSRFALSIRDQLAIVERLSHSATAVQPSHPPVPVSWNSS